MLGFKELMDKTIIKPANLKRSDHLNIQQLREEHNEVLNDAKDNDTTETI